VAIILAKSSFLRTKNSLVLWRLFQYAACFAAHFVLAWPKALSFAEIVFVELEVYGEDLVVLLVLDWLGSQSLILFLEELHAKRFSLQRVHFHARRVKVAWLQRFDQRNMQHLITRGDLCVVEEGNLVENRRVMRLLVLLPKRLEVLNSPPVSLSSPL
jgi:hypothetical protein